MFFNNSIVNKRGFTLPEVMVAVFLLSLAGMMTLGSTILAMKMDRTVRAESLLYSEGYQIMDRIQFGDQGLYGVMKASAASVNISVDQKQISFLIDSNATYTTNAADDATSSIYFSNGDGDDATYADNVLIVDPNIAAVNDEYTIGSGIANLSFSESSGVVTVDLTVTDTVTGADVSINLSRSFWMRNT